MQYNPLSCLQVYKRGALIDHVCTSMEGECRVLRGTMHRWKKSIKDGSFEAALINENDRLNTSDVMQRVREDKST